MWIYPLQFVLGVYVLFLLFEEMPKTMVICGIISQIAHLSIIQTFPIFEILSPSFVTTVGNINQINFIHVITIFFYF